MRVLRRIPRTLCAIGIGTTGWASAQNDGDHPKTDGSGQTYLTTDASVGGGTVQPLCFTVGTTPNAASALVVEGGQMSTPTGEVFRTIGPASTDTYWHMFRNTDEIGRIYGTASGNGFNIRQYQSGGSLWNRNYSSNGLRVIDDVNFNLNGYNTNPRVGYVAIGETSTMASPGGSLPALPWAKLHLVHGSNATSDFGYRPWMQNGTLITGNSDQMYVGHKYGSNDASDAVIQWSEDGTIGTSNQKMRFLFTTTPTGAGSGAASDEGLEMMRLVPQSSSSGYVGIGDFYVGTDNPTERLDIRTGNLRIRDLPGTGSTSDTKVMVVDANGVVHWRPTSAIVAEDCEWTMSSSAPNDVYTAVGGTSASCPDGTEHVSIGTTYIPAKLTVYEDTPGDGSTTDDRGVEVHVEGDNTGQNIGLLSGVDLTADAGRSVAQTAVWGQVKNGADAYALRGSATMTSSNTSTNVYGLYTTADDGAGAGAATNVYGAKCYGEGGNSSMTVYGLHAKGASYGASGTSAYGVWGEAYGGTSNNYAFWSQGDSKASGTWIDSDAMFKTDVEDVQDGLAKIIQLQPKTYYMDTVNYGYLGFNSLPQIGLLAAEVAAVVPEVVRTAVQPDDVDSSGNILHASFPFKVMNYTELIPLLISAVKEQQTQIEQLQAQVNGCCPGIEGGDGQQMMGSGGSEGMNEGTMRSDDEQLKIQPNPFGDATTITYTIAEAGKVRLVVSTMSGKQLLVLREEQNDAGSYTYEWNTSSLAAGMYNVMLLEDGAPMVQKAVKIDR